MSLTTDLAGEELDVRGNAGRAVDPTAKQPAEDLRTTARFNNQTAGMYAANCGKNYRRSGLTKMVQIPIAFSVDSVKGLMHGRPGDWLAVDADGDPYVVANSVHEKTYTLARARSKAK